MGKIQCRVHTDCLKNIIFMTECQNDLRPKEKDGLETAEIVRLVPLEGSEVGHSIVKNCKDFYYITLLH